MRALFPGSRTVALFAAAAAALCGQESRTNDRLGPGVHEVRFDRREPLGDIKEQRKRFGWSEATVKQNDPRGGEYRIEDRTFKVYVPPTLEPGKPAGLLVWISPGETGLIPQDWPPALDAARMIVVGADGAGNEIDVWYRVGLALDAATNARKRFDVDPRRVYVGGFSGGGRTATRVAMHYPEVFRGGLYMGGCSYYRDVANPKDAASVWPAKFPEPPGERGRLARRERGHVFVAGADDFNAASMRATHRRAKEIDGFRHAHWIEMPGVGHAPPNAEFLARALALLDAVGAPPAPATRPASRPAAPPAASRPARPR